MTLHVTSATEVCTMLGNKLELRCPYPSSDAEYGEADPILAAAIFFCAAEVACWGADGCPAEFALAEHVLSKVTSSLGLLDTNRVFDLMQAEDGMNLVCVNLLTGITESSLLIPMLATSDSRGYKAMEECIFDAGIVIHSFIRVLSTPGGSYFNSEMRIALTQEAQAFQLGVSALLLHYGDTFALTGRMVNNAVPWSVISGNADAAVLLKQLESLPVSSINRTSWRLAYRHLKQTAVVTAFVLEALEGHIDNGRPLPDHDALIDAVTKACPNWIVEPSRSMLLETVAYSLNRKAKECRNQADSLYAYMRGTRFAWRAVMSSRIPRHAKYVAENLAQASKRVSDPFGKKSADAIFCSAYTVGHLQMCVSITATKLGLKPSEGSNTTIFRCADEWLKEWVAIPAYKENPFFVQRFMNDIVKVTSDNLVVNLLAGVILIEQFLRDLPEKWRDVDGIEHLHLLTAYTHEPENVLTFEDRPLLFAEPFLWAFQVLRLALSQGSGGIKVVASCGFSSLEPKAALAIADTLNLTTTPEVLRPARTYLDCLPSLVNFLNFLARQSPDCSEEKDYLCSLNRSLASTSFN